MAPLWRIKQTCEKDHYNELCKQKSRWKSVSDSGEVEGDGDLVQEAYIYLTEHRYPQDCTYAQKRSIRKKAGKFVVRDGELFFKKKRKGKV